LTHSTDRSAGCGWATPESDTLGTAAPRAISNTDSGLIVAAWVKKRNYDAGWDLSNFKRGLVVASKVSAAAAAAHDSLMGEQARVVYLILCQGQLYGDGFGNNKHFGSCRT